MKWSISGAGCIESPLTLLGGSDPQYHTRRRIRNTQWRLEQWPLLCMLRVFGGFETGAGNTQKLGKLQELEENCLKVLIVYDTSSMNRNTEKVAKTMSEVLKQKGFDVDCLHVKDVDQTGVKNYDCVLAGSPTQILRATRPIMQFLEGFGRDEFSGKLAAAFDTQLQGRITGNAAKGIEKKLEKLGFKIVMPPLVTYVEGKLENIQLKSGEIEKTKKYAEDLAKTLRS